MNEHLLSDLPLALPAEARTVVYVDNVWVFARDRRGAERIKELLQAATERHRAGRLRLKPIGIRRVADGFEILGYRMRTRYGRVEVEPRADKLLQTQLLCLSLIRARKDLDYVETFARSWSASFGLWPGATVFRDMTLASVAATRGRMATSQG